MISGSLIAQKCENNPKFPLVAYSTLNFTQIMKKFARALPAMPATFKNSVQMYSAPTSVTWLSCCLRLGNIAELIQRTFRQGKTKKGIYLLLHC